MMFPATDVQVVEWVYRIGRTVFNWKWLDSTDSARSGAQWKNGILLYPVTFITCKDIIDVVIRKEQIMRYPGRSTVFANYLAASWSTGRCSTLTTPEKTDKPRIICVHALPCRNTPTTTEGKVCLESPPGAYKHETV